MDRAEVLRYLGYPAHATPSRRLEDALDCWIPEAKRLATPRAIYVVLPIAELSRRSLRLQAADGITEFNGAIGEFLGASRRVAAFIATAGVEVERLASKLMREGDDLAALVVSAAGAERAEAAEAVVLDELREQANPAGWAPTLPYSPGYCGMELTEQTKLFALLGPQNVGVTLSPDCLMCPLKSVSGLIGLGPADEIKAYGSPCDRCDMHNCDMRR